MPRPSVVLLAALLFITAVAGKDEEGDSCSIPEQHCGAPKSGLGCCLGKTGCYELTTDCAKFIKSCPFTNDSKKGSGLFCLPDASKFNRTKCPADVAGSQDAVANADAACYVSNKLTCNVFTNSSGAKHIEAKCKETPPGQKSSGHSTAASSVLMVVMAAGGLLAML